MGSKKVNKLASWGPFSRSMRKERAVQSGQNESFIRDGRSQSEDGSPRATLEDEDDTEADQGICQSENMLCAARCAANLPNACVNTELNPSFMYCCAVSIGE